MSLCPMCSQQLRDDAVVCAQHTGVSTIGWAAGNRIMCDFLHRGIAPPRLSAIDRVDDLARQAAEAA